MDLLCKAYGDVSDEDGEFENLGEGKYKRQRPIPPPKRPCSEGYAPVQSRSPAVVLPAQPPSRYVSKRDRAILSAEATSTPSAALPLPNPPITNVEPPVGSTLDSELPSDILNLLKCKKNAAAAKSRVSTGLLVSLNGHTSAVNSIQWSKSHGHLLASASMDQAVYVWNVWNKNQQKVCALRYHNAAGTETQMFKEEQTVEVVRFHPENSSLFLSGGSKGLLRLWDIRVGAVVKEYLKGLGPILDVEFSRDGKTFISSSDTSNSRISENSIILWDVMRQVPLSNQVYAEAYTCTCVRYHPYGSCFIAQSNGNYIAVFSARLPYKLDKYKRYENHGVWGFPVKCNFSMNGQQIASGSSDGCIYLYDYKSSNLLKKIKAFEQPCVDVAFHPTIPDVIASCSWRGEISVFG
ncbi:WD repeat-containing protein 25-like isoform X2 [Zingiber officinale]|uniref:WD repeat-containing protein 25-like isoform X2 n=1 Tax=Zingiber officinale TaxID=94328 RepID=UPI001C4BA7DB|nr:WD repeat-containing protein 25-like isoform X2 [Zingiber officinale]